MLIGNKSRVRTLEKLRDEPNPWVIVKEHEEVFFKADKVRVLQCRVLAMPSGQAQLFPLSITPSGGSLFLIPALQELPPLLILPRNPSFSSTKKFIIE